MIRLLVVTVVAIYAILQVFGDPDRRPEPVARSTTSDVELIPAAYTPSTDEPISTYVSPISDSEAVEIALAAGAEIRQSRTAAALRGTATAPRALESVDVALAAAEPAVEAPVLWNVIGTRVNLRSGPGTSNAVVGQVTEGTQAELLAEADGWYQIRSADGTTSGWIFGKFLQPG